MDEISHKELHQPTDREWDRRLHAQALDRLIENGASIVAFDVLFDKAKKEQDEDFRVAISNAAGRVILASTMSLGSPFSRQIQPGLIPSPTLGSHTPQGIINLPTGVFGIVRQHETEPLIDPSSEIATMGARVRQLYFDEAIPKHLDLWIRYYGPPGSLGAVSYHDLLSNPVPESVRGSVAFVGLDKVIGSSGPNVGDQCRTPHYWLGQGLMTGVEVQATIALNLIHGDHLRTVSPLGESVGIAFVGLMAGGWFSRCRSVRKKGLAAVWAITAICAFGLLLFAGFGLVCSWLIPGFFQIPLALALGSMYPHSTAYQAFICYRRAEGADFSRWLRDGLVHAGIPCFLDGSNIEKGDPWPPTIDSAIRQCKVFLVIMSPGVLDRCLMDGDQVRRELTLAKLAGCRVVPVYLDGFSSAEFAKFAKSMTSSSQRESLQVVLDLGHTQGIKHHPDTAEQTLNALIELIGPS